MRRLTVDTSEAQSFELAEPGPYNMRVHSISDPQTGPKAKYVEVQLEFEDPLTAKRCGRVFRNYPINGPGAGFFREFWKAATQEELPIGEAAVDVDLDAAIGARIVVDIGHSEARDGYAPRNEPKRVTALV